MASESKNDSRNPPLQVAGLFAGVGGIELGLSRSGHAAVEFCELDDSAHAVLSARFPGIPIHRDIRELRELAPSVSMITAGFPCQDLSQAGTTLGLDGERSSLVEEVFWLLRRHEVPWVLLENVPFMLRLQRGRTLDIILGNLEELGYSWAYRVIDSRAFGLPQRRKRVYILASLDDDPRNVLLSDSVLAPPEQFEPHGRACGFYWTEGTRGLGWAVDAVPTLKGGSTIGIPSPPAVWFNDGRIAKPGIRDVERLQGFEPDWTQPAEDAGRASLRWKLVGNAVTVDVAEWIGKRLRHPGRYRLNGDRELMPGKSWPNSAYNIGEGRAASWVSEFPMNISAPPLHEFLNLDEVQDLSLRAVSGFLSRYEASSLSRPPGFLEAVRAHRAKMENRAAQVG